MARGRIREAARKGLELGGNIGRCWQEPPYGLVLTTRPTREGAGKTHVVKADDLLELLSRPQQPGHLVPLRLKSERGYSR